VTSKFLIDGRRAWVRDVVHFGVLETSEWGTSSHMERRPSVSVYAYIYNKGRGFDGDRWRDVVRLGHEWGTSRHMWRRPSVSECATTANGVRLGIWGDVVRMEIEPPANEGRLCICRARSMFTVSTGLVTECHRKDAICDKLSKLSGRRRA
jgi:hypothetical protein